MQKRDKKKPETDIGQLYQMLQNAFSARNSLHLDCKESTYKKRPFRAYQLLNL